MAKVLKDECYDCKADGYPCLGNSCPNRKVPHYYCDKCKDEFDSDELYDTEYGELCEECLLKQFKTVKEKECSS